jgi:aspartate kinase
VEDKYKNIETLTAKLSQKFQVSCKTNVELFTIRHFTPEAVENIEKDPTVVLTQILGKTLQVIREEK